MTLEQCTDNRVTHGGSATLVVTPSLQSCPDKAVLLETRGRECSRAFRAATFQWLATTVEATTSTTAAVGAPVEKTASSFVDRV